MADNQGEVEKYRAAVKGEVPDETVELVVRSAQATEGTKLLFAQSGIRAQKLFVYPTHSQPPPRIITPDYFKHFVGERAPVHFEAQGNGLLVSPDYPLLYEDTTNYIFTTNLSNRSVGTDADRTFYLATILFTDKDNKGLGTWTGIYYEVDGKWTGLPDHKPIYTFGGPGSWTVKDIKDEDEGVTSYTAE